MKSIAIASLAVSLAVGVLCLGPGAVNAQFGGLPGVGIGEQAAGIGGGSFGPLASPEPLVPMDSATEGGFPRGVGADSLGDGIEESVGPEVSDREPGETMPSPPIVGESPDANPEE